MKKFLFLPVLLATVCAWGVTLDNGLVKLTVAPSSGGKIVSFSSSGAKYDVPPQQIAEPAFGLAKERIYGDSWEYAAAAAEMVSCSSGSIVMLIAPQNPPQAHLEVTKTITLLPQRKYAVVTLKYRNTTPLAGAFKIVPWLHNSFIIAPDAAAENCRFYIPHSGGIGVTALNRQVIGQSMLESGGNWIAYYDAGKKRGLLFVSQQMPQVTYNYVSGRICSAEFIYAAVDPIPDFTISYCIAPLDALTPQAVAALQLPYPVTPAIPEKITPVPGKNISLEKKFKTAAEKKLPVAFKYWKQRADVAPQIPLPLVFGVRNLANRKDVCLEIDLPQELDYVGCVGEYWWGVGEKMELASRSDVTVSGRKVKRLRFNVQARHSADFLPSHCRVLVKANRAGGDYNIVYRSIAGDSVLEEKSVPGRVIALPRSRMPQKFTTLMGVDYALLRAWPDFTGAMRHLGVNGVCLNDNVPNKAVSADEVKKLTGELRRQKFMTAVMGIFFAPPGYLAGRYPADLQAKDINGKMVQEFDFTARGPWMRSVAEKTAERALMLGFDLAISDYEPYFGANAISFTPRTVDKFRKYFAAKGGKLVWIEPRELANAPGKHPEQYRLWIDFKCREFADYVASAVAEGRKVANSATRMGWCTIPGSSDESIKIDNIMDNRLFCDFLDVTSPMLYDNLYRTMNSYRFTLDMFRKYAAASSRKPQVMPTLSAGFWGESNTFPPEHTFYILLETALMQCPGAYIFPGFAGSDGENIREIGRALDLIARYEDLIYGAKQANYLVKTVDCRNTGLNLPTSVEPLVLVNGKRGLLYLAEYSKYPVTLKLSSLIPVALKVTDAMSGEKLPVLRQGTEIAISLPPSSKGRLLLLESLDNKDIPVVPPPVGTAEKAALSADTVYADDFEGSTQGVNGVKGHSFSFDDRGFAGKCLFLRDYESCWLLERELKFKSGNITIDFQYKIPRPFSGGGINWELVRGKLNDILIYWLFLDKSNGKMCLAIGKENPGKPIDWFFKKYSKSAVWPGDVWMNIRLTLGKDGVALSVDGRPEIAGGGIWPVVKAKDTQIGRRWVSVGRFDSLRIRDGK